MIKRKSIPPCAKCPVWGRFQNGSNFSRAGERRLTAFRIARRPGSWRLVGGKWSFSSNGKRTFKPMNSLVPELRHFDGRRDAQPCARSLQLRLQLFVGECCQLVISVRKARSFAHERSLPRASNDCNGVICRHCGHSGWHYDLLNESSGLS